MTELETNTRRTLVLRYHSLGDVVLATGVARALAETGRTIEMATEHRFRLLLEGLPFLDRLWERDELEGAARADTGARPRFDLVVDLQGTPGSRALCRRLGPVRSIRRHGLARRWVVFWGDRFPRPAVPHAVARYASAAGLDATDVDRLRPELRVTPEDVARAREEAAELLPRLHPETRHRPGARPQTAGSVAQAKGREPLVVLLTGASRASKAYPEDRFAEVARRFAEAGWIVAWVADPARPPSEPAPVPGLVPVRVSLSALKAVLERADLAVSSDSGPMHMAAALSVPLVAIFASSVRAFGFAPLGHTRLLETEDVACRPCGVHGRDRCWLGHWRCREVAPAEVVRTGLDLYNAGGARRRDAPAPDGATSRSSSHPPEGEVAG